MAAGQSAGSPDRQRPTAVPATLQLSLQDEAVAFYLNHYMEPLPPDALGVTRSLDDYICQLSVEFHSDLLGAAIRCMALETYSRVWGYHERASAEAVQHHRTLLSLARRSVWSLSAETMDEGLLGVFFLSRFDASTHTPAALMRKLSESRVHHYNGAMAMLKYWVDHLRGGDGEVESHCRPASSIVKESRRGLLRFLLMHTLEVPGWMKDGEAFGEIGLEQIYDRVTVRTADLRHQVSRLIREQTEGIFSSHESGLPSLDHRLSDLDKEARDLDRMLRHWVDQFQVSWTYQQHTLKPPDDPDRTERAASPSKIYTYSSMSYSMLWAKYAAVRLLVNDAHLKIISLRKQTLVVTDLIMESHCRLVVEQMTDIIVYSKAFFMGELQVSRTPMGEETVGRSTRSNVCQARCKYATWPLSVACSLETVDGFRRLWCKWELHRVGRLAGIKFFEEYQPSNHGFRLD
ncbi:uncharacterized protein PG998_001651 [Apiospora kogelbergensis]|uniref:uncharacterized protein n=1 Tax=Apiospora kogelbergensis TaxID=1337665 RepID=UPI00312D6492